MKETNQKPNAEETLKENFSHKNPKTTMHYVGITKEETVN